MKVASLLVFLLIGPTFAMAKSEIPKMGSVIWSDKHGRYCTMKGTYTLGDGGVAGIIVEVTPTNPWKSDYIDVCPLGQFISQDAHPTQEGSDDSVHLSELSESAQ